MNKRWLIFFVAVLLTSCHKEPSNNNNNQTNLPAAKGLPVTVTIDDTKPGNKIPADFAGLSYETKILATNPEVLNANNKLLIQLIKNLGPGLLRIGGDSSDETFWTGNSRTTGTGTDSITTTDVDNLTAFSKAIGWPVLFGLNLGYNNKAAAADEALYVYNSLGSNLFALQSGNEPDVYHIYGLRTPAYSAADYLSDYEVYKAAIQSKVPNASFAGPGPAYNTDFIPAFTKFDLTNVKLIDAHYYATGPASDPGITYHTIFNSNWKLDNLLFVISGESSKFNLPYRLTECNNVYGGGKKGVSDIFASALWALDFMWKSAQNNCQGINFHGGIGLFYSPVRSDNGMTVASPEYYAMLAFKYGGIGGTVIPANNNQANYNISTYACINPDGTTGITLINKDDTSDMAFTVQMSKTLSSVQIERLAAPSITSTTGTTFAGNMVSPDGTFTASFEQYNVYKKSFVINLPAASAAVITVK